MSAKTDQFEVLYTAAVTSSGGRMGGVKSDDDTLDLRLALPASMGGRARGTNPEQLLAASYAACFLSSLQLVGHDLNLSHNVQVTAKVSLNRCSADDYNLSAELHIALPMLTREQAHALVVEAHKVCPVSRALQNNVNVTIVVSEASDI